MVNPYRCVLLFGPPGVGKGTQGKRLGAMDGYVHLATGDIFRALDPDSPHGAKFHEYSSQGLLVPDELTVEIWHEHVEGMIANGQYSPSKDLLVLDGIPRSVTQVQLMKAYIDVEQILFFEVSDIDVMVERIKRRGEEQNRHDDMDESVIRRRYEEYDEKTAPVIGCYASELIGRIDPIGTMDEVFGRIQDALRIDSSTGAA
ncbi:MAG: nucleoside monophosphate kinase [Planctomycetota bacterium]